MKNKQPEKQNPTTYIYITTDGGKTELIPGRDGVTQAFIETLYDCDRLEYNNNQTETRRHITLDNGCDDGEWLAVEDNGIATLIADETRADKLWRAISLLKPKQQKLIQSIYFDGISVNEYAAREGVDHSAISHRLQTIIKKLKIFFENPHISRFP